jgi:tetratricopeptide (TPR) repeat protein
MKKGFYYIIALLIVSLFWSCSTKKNTKASRFYHAFNSRYNIYFNGKTSFDEALLSMQNGYKESYSDMILMYPISAQPKDKPETGGPFDRAIEKSNKAIKLHSIKAKPPKKPGWRNDPKQRAWQEQEEYNPFLKKCWLMMGQAQFYNADFLQASATFSYIARHYAHDEEVVAEARLWQARCYSEMEWFYEAEDILGKLNTNGIPRKNLNQYAAVYADYLVKNKQYEEAVPYFKTAIKAEKNRRQRTRMKYLLGQIYAEQDQNGLAYQMFGQVIKANPPYELEFAARIRQTEVFTGGNYQKVIKMLQRMAKSDKNKDLLDQVYYALGNVYMSREDTVNAIKNYELGVEKSTQNGLDKAICQIKLGDLYFQKRDYVKAQPNFSGALSGIQKEYKDYERVSKLSAILDELVVHVEAVHLQDSLQTLAKMPESERLAVIDKIIEQVKKKVKKRKIGAVCRFVYDRAMPQDFLDFLVDAYRIDRRELVPGDKHLNMEDLRHLPNPNQSVRPIKKPQPMKLTCLDERESIFRYVEKKDLLLHYPYHSFDHFIHFLYEAVHEPTVREIMVTQYRVAENSTVINTLIAAAQNGKKVTVFVELKARFDEENNLATAEMMKAAGINIIFSIPGLKVHAKVALVLRRDKEGRKLTSYAYISTGNFNEKTATLYADSGLFTCNPVIVNDLHNLFRTLQGKENPVFHRLLVARFNLIPELNRLINHEIELTRQGKQGRIILKMNALQDPAMIDRLYEASQAGVEIDLIVRGICCLIPGQEYSHNIRVTRIVDTFLEHARVWYFGNGGAPKLFLGSPDAA